MAETKELQPWLLEGNDVCLALKVDKRTGLSDAEVRERQRVHGKNEIPSPEGTITPVA